MGVGPAGSTDGPGVAGAGLFEPGSPGEGVIAASAWGMRA